MERARCGSRTPAPPPAPGSPTSARHPPCGSSGRAPAHYKGPFTSSYSSRKQDKAVRSCVLTELPRHRRRSEGQVVKNAGSEPDGNVAFSRSWWLWPLTWKATKSRHRVPNRTPSFSSMPLVWRQQQAARNAPEITLTCDDTEPSSSHLLFRECRSQCVRRKAMLTMGGLEGAMFCTEDYCGVRRLSLPGGGLITQGAVSGERAPCEVRGQSPSRPHRSR